MRLQQYYKFWESLYEADVKNCINEIIDLTTRVKKISDREWHFWIGTDSYTVRTRHIGNNCYHISFVYTDYLDNEISSITDKHTPFSVMDGMAVVMKELIQEKSPKFIEYIVMNSKKKVDMFKRASMYIIKKHSDVFGEYKVRTEMVDIRDKLPPDIPSELVDLSGMRFVLERQ